MKSKDELKNRSFISNLKQLLNCDQYNDIIIISKDYKGFTILDKEKFKNDVLKNHFNHCNLASFRRQLNQYGFVYQRTDEGYLQYTNQQFDIKNQDSLKIPKQIQQNQLTYDQEMLLLKFQLSEIKYNQVKMAESIQNLLKQQQQIEINLKKSMIEYISHVVDGQKRGTTLGRFVWKFHLNIKDKKYSNKEYMYELEKFLNKIWLKANQQGELMLSDPRQPSKFFHHFYSCDNDSIFGIMFPSMNPINKQLLSLCSYVQNSQEEDHLEEKQSNISNYFNI